MDEKYSVTWQGPSQSRAATADAPARFGSADSMPLGGYDLGLNVWAEDGQVMIYACQSGAYDENGTLLKLCRLRLRLSGMALDAGMTQTLYPTRGCIEIREGDACLVLWAAVDKPELHIDYAGPASAAALAVDSWRWRDRPISARELGQCRDMQVFGNGVTRADRVRAADGEVLCCHANGEDTVYPRLIAEQGLEGVRGSYRDRLRGRVSGALVLAPGLSFAGAEPYEYAGVDARAQVLRSGEARAEWHITLTALSCQCAGVDEWEARLRARATRPADSKRAQLWWRERFERSFIDIDEADPASPGHAIARNAALFRYMQLCNWAGAFPTKFNGGLFTFDEGFTPDYRNWGGITFTAQNQRHVYWPLLRSGDFDAMLTQFDFYRNITPAQKALTREACGHGGAFFDEHPSIFGMTCAAEYEVPGRGRREGIEYWDMDNFWVRLHFSSALEFALMILEYERYCGGDIAPYLDFIDSAVRFYMEHYPRRADGTLHIFPSTALETYKGPDPRSADAAQYGAGDPMDAVAGLRAVLDMLIARGGEHAAEYRAWRAICPELPTGVRNGHRQFLPAAEFSMPPTNCELPQLYRVFPYSPDGLNAGEVELGRATWRYGIDTDDQRLHVSWHQNGIFAARLGLLNDAMYYLEHKLGDSPRRFPAFWGPGHDWSPDHNWGGSGCVQLQEMLMRADGDKLLLFPCWPREWDAHFKLHGPGGVTVEAEMRAGEARVISVSPARARARVRIAGE